MTSKIFKLNYNGTVYISPGEIFILAVTINDAMEHFRLWSLVETQKGVEGETIAPDTVDIPVVTSISILDTPAIVTTSVVARLATGQSKLIDEAMKIFLKDPTPNVTSTKT